MFSSASLNKTGRNRGILAGDVLSKSAGMRSRCIRSAEIFRYFLAVTLGFSLHFFLDFSRIQTHCPKCQTCPTTPESNDLLKTDVLQLREPYKPNSMYDVIRYDYFNSSKLLLNVDGRPIIDLLGKHKSDFKDILHQTMALLNSGKYRSWKLKKLINGYRRFDPLRGEEFLFDVEIQADDPAGGPNPIEEVHRMEIVKPYGVAQLIKDQVVTNDKMIHFVLPASSQVADRFQEFLHYFEEICLQTLEHVYLMIVLFVGQTERERNKANDMKLAAQQLSRQYRKAHIRIVQTSNEFSRAVGLDLGAKQLPPDALLFFCDTDVSISPDFLTRCRHNAIQGKQVYYPITFAQYNPDIVKEYSPEGKVNGLNEINKYTGHWVHYGYGMTCLYNSDYRSVGGYDLEKKGWGGEDVELFKKHVRSSLNVFRAMDPALIHRYHPKSCDSRLPSKQLNMCIDSLAEGYGANSQLAKKILMP